MNVKTKTQILMAQGAMTDAQTSVLNALLYGSTIEPDELEMIAIKLEIATNNFRKAAELARKEKQEAGE